MNRQQEVTRVLAHSGARLLTEEEFEQVAGSFHTARCTLITSCTTDGDCGVPMGCPPPG